MTKRNNFSFSKTIFVTLFLIITIIMGTSAQLWAKETVKVGIFQNKPVVYFEDKPKGLFVETLDYVAEIEGWDIEYIPCKLQECIELINSNELDIMTSLGKNPARLQLLTFSEEPIWTFWGTVYAHDHTISSLFDLKDRNIGVRRKNKITFSLQKLLADFEIPARYVPFDNYEEAFTALNDKKIDVVAVNNTYGFEEQRKSDTYQTSIVFSPFSAYFAAPKNGRHVKKLAVIDTYVKALKADKDSFFYTFQQKQFGGVQPYWTGKRIGIIGAIFLIIIVFGMASWRYRSLISINRELTKSIFDRRQVESEQKHLLYNMGKRIKELKCMYAVAELIGKQKTMEETYKEVVTLIPPAWQYPEITCARLCFDDQEWSTESFTETQWKQSADIIVYGKVRGSIEVFYLKQCQELDEGPFVSEERNLIDAIARSMSEFSELNDIRADQERLLHAIYQASESVVITDLKGTIQYINPSFEKLTGYSREEVIGQNSRILKSGQHDPAFYKEMWNTLLRGKVWRGRLINRKKDGSLFEEEATISAVRDIHGQLTNFVAMKRDVSREVSLEKQLQQAMKMEAIGTLAGGIAHDFNNILAAILGYGEIANVQLPDNHPVKKDILQVIKAGNRAKELVKQILAFSRQGEICFSPLKIQSIIKEALKLLRSSLPTTIQIQERVDPNCRPVLADPTQIHQVIMNFCTNAKHAMESHGGILTVSLSEVEATDSKSIPGCPQLTNGVYLDLSVRDTGCGIEKSTQTKIFDPFFTTKKTGKGTGLGLSVVHGIIKQHQGDVTVESALGRGTVFHVYLPIIDKEMPAKTAPTMELPRGKERILLVDDEPSVLEMMRRMLADLGYTVTAFTGSIEALNTYRANPDTFDLLITDMTMPNLTGTILAKKVLNIRPDLPIILCTGYSESMDKKQAESLGIREFLLKPILKKQLAATIRKALTHG
jgi:PAS domain S-box-containing protein